MPYTPDPTNASQPSDSEAAGTAAAEFRALKGRVNALAATLVTGAKNKIINGKMEVAQRGTSFPGLTSPIPGSTYSYPTLDQWRFATSSAGVVTVSQSTDVPSSNEFQSSLRLEVTTADTSITATDRVLIRAPIEGYNARDLIGRTFTISFWVRSPKTGVHCISLLNASDDRSYVLEYTITTANTWEFKTVTVTGGLITAGGWNWTTGRGVLIQWCLASGTTYQTTAGAWQVGNFIATSSQVNCLDAISNIFGIVGAQLEVGSSATSFEHRLYGVELLLCQRYYQVLSGVSANAYAISGTNFRVHVPYKATMRSTPTATTGGETLANASSVSYTSITTNALAVNLAAISSAMTGIDAGFIRLDAEL